MNHETTRLAELVATLFDLKRIKRTGWLDRGAPPDAVESVADHSFLTALVAWLVALDRPDLDADRVLKLAVIHDIAEAIVGDIPPYAPDDVPDASDPDALQAFFSVRHRRTDVAAEEKRAAEQLAIQHLATRMPPTAGAAVLDLWEEYEARETAEARFVKEVDTLEAFLESRAMAGRFQELPLWGFTDMANKEIGDPGLAGLRDAASAVMGRSEAARKSNR